MKLGLVLECDAEGPDALVLTCFARRLSPGIVVQPVSLGSHGKEQVFNNGVQKAAGLVENSGCDLVIIAWDLKPYWEKAPARTCEAEANDLRAKLEVLPKNTRAKIRLLCITWALETWLIANPEAVRAHLSTESHKSKFKCPAPLNQPDPKAALNTACIDHRGGRSGRYVDYREAIQIARRITDISKLMAIPSFARFARLLTGIDTPAFQATGDTCEALVYKASRLGRN